jgi:hypothetical protein
MTLKILFVLGLIVLAQITLDNPEATPAYLRI